MVQELKIILVLLWAPQALRQILAWTYWIQVKEYRFDRFRVFLLSAEGRRKLNFYFIAAKLVASGLAVLKSDALFVVTTLLFLVGDFGFFIDLGRRKLRRPIFTERAKRIISTGILFIALGLLLIFILGSLGFLVGEVLILASAAIGVLWTVPYVNRAKRKEIKEAKIKLKNYKPLVIGITGSYGKTTTKEFLAHILSKKYKVVKTDKSENTDFGIVRKINSELKGGVEIFIAEMGAYKRGEIRKLAEIVNPSIGLVTGIEPQHLELFGSLENVKAAKFELIEKLPKGGAAFFNLSSPQNHDLFEKAKKSERLAVYSYVLVKGGRKKNTRINYDIESVVVEANVDGVRFKVFDGKVEKEILSPLRGVHFVENLTGAILVARHLGVAWRDISEACRSLKTPDSTMTTKKLSYGAVLIDDSYNSTPKGFAAALNYLSYYKGKRKILITPGIIELGPESQSVHKKLGKKIDESVDRLIVLNKEPALFIKSGLSNLRNNIEIIEDAKDLVQRLERLIEEGYVILVEGRIPKEAIDFIYKRLAL